MNRTQIDIPSLVRVKTGAVGRVGIYARRHGFMEVALLHSADLHENLMNALCAGLQAENIAVLQRWPIREASFEQAREYFPQISARTRAIIGFGGGKALDVAKYVAFLTRLPYLAVPTSLSNDGFCSPQSSLTLEGRRKSLPSAMPFGVVIDTEVCLAAPDILWHAGVGDLVAKLTAVADWKLAFHAVGTLVDDFAALLSDASVFQFIARPTHDLEGVRLLGTALMLNGIAMAVCGSSRPASGSEHLISHALDSLSERPRMHGLQVGVATYLISLLQKQNSTTIADLFSKTGFWRTVAADPFRRDEWLEAIRRAPSIKQDFYTVLSSRDCLPEAEAYLHNDPHLRACFVD
ncbi:MAG TPA: iron-containing alcohol dehydrogenase family protein [Kiritimatiellia bacterium]|jgi:glycerol-1-phosphate dehydrogenase [NAD(P)+]|nr:iron-containing alcohol dehydrogenase family protein [Kiritimatiellia bacterium]HOU58467.1 iron-containing alcohol dehydrogenase family protein [Kiritimatiellia bacterium]HPK70063.1 iron-containing alcohol dehydrogenase family protein [Kiritimatiellia bacterium]HPV46494.1 iron-containing alcohol dehydrogenase family protein [Kiritimatiellia bacterium]HQK43835.1 iron-containing alcohol dehydrogenase family protein [Kiritimatiellia bacterium]